jgi:TnpA family transposase
MSQEYCANIANSAILRIFLMLSPHPVKRASGDAQRPHNRFGFALQLCVLRYPGRVLAPGEVIPAKTGSRDPSNGTPLINSRLNDYI